MRILIIEDDDTAAMAAQAMLGAERAAVDRADLGEDGLEMAKLYDYDAILLDVGLPDMDGHTVLLRLRRAKVAAPVIMVTGADGVPDKVRALSGGADDYVTKPYSRGELMARIQAVVRRAKGHSENVVRIGRLEVDFGAKSVSVDGRTIPLTGKEYGILELLAMRSSMTITKEMFLNHLYNGMDEPEIKIIDVFVCKLRKKLKDTLGEDPIETVWGRGYTLRAAADPDRHQRAAAE